jgi:hypothetical protein
MRPDVRTLHLYPGEFSDLCITLSAELVSSGKIT